MFSFVQIDPDRERAGRQCLKMSLQVKTLCSVPHFPKLTDGTAELLFVPVCLNYIYFGSESSLCFCLQCPQWSASRCWELWSVCRPNWSRGRSGPTVTPWATWRPPCRAHCSTTSWPCSTPSNSSKTRSEPRHIILQCPNKVPWKKVNNKILLSDFETFILRKAGEWNSDVKCVYKKKSTT